MTCRICDFDEVDESTGYGALIGVCAHCANRIYQLYERQHGGKWPMPWRVDQADLDWWRDDDEATERRDALASAAKKKISSPLRFKVYERDGFKCVYCGSRKDLSCDHVTAESKGGATTEGNLVTCCKSCNSKKKTKTLADFWGARQ